MRPTSGDATSEKRGHDHLVFVAVGRGGYIILPQYETLTTNILYFNTKISKRSDINITLDGNYRYKKNRSRYHL